MTPSAPGDPFLDEFFQRVWTADVQPLLRGELARQRGAAARIGGKAAAVGGGALDKLFGLKGRPFQRSLTVLGASFGAMLPDLWDWGWLRERVSQELRARVDAEVERKARELEIREALSLFGLAPTSTREELKQAWRAASLRWHPDKASPQEREEYHTRFVALRAAYQRLHDAYDAGRLPRKSS